ncbi:MAG: anaerobic ribonucleoside-triphosphate reductase activating protein [Clostridia bacterium]|nr:anaerobic ribonucleoside-triphosphate reductase activating protein [Clostridia bacterium]
MNFATIKWYDISNGPGVRVSLYVSGCRNQCKNCFNPETWDFGYGQPFTEEVEDKILDAMEPEYIRGFTLLGGDPFEPENAEVLAPFMRKMRKRYPEKSLWCFTGYDYERDLLTGKKGDPETVMKILRCLDVLVDGRFVEELKDLNLRFRGSSNQRIILVKESLKRDKIILWDGEKEQ